VTRAAPATRRVRQSGEIDGPAATAPPGRLCVAVYSQMASAKDGCLGAAPIVGCMTRSRTRLDRRRLLTSDTDLADQLGRLLEQAYNPRQLWLLFLDPEDRLSDVIMPCDDYPLDPDEQFHNEELGLTDYARLLAARLSEILELASASRVVLVWERPGPPAFDDDDLTWARAMSDACRAEGVPLRAQFRLHDGGIRILTPDDYAGVR
jgi:hypothetical protein